MRMKGSVAAETNHSSITSQLGNGGSFTISEQIVKLMERQHNLYNKTCAMEDNSHIKNTRYISTNVGDIGDQDKCAKIKLSEYAYKNIWEPALKNRVKYQHLFIVKIQEYVVWPNGVDKSKDNSVVIPQFLLVA